MNNESKELSHAFIKLLGEDFLIEFSEDIMIIAKYNHLGGQLQAYQKILQIMEFKKK